MSVAKTLPVTLANTGATIRPSTPSTNRVEESENTLPVTSPSNRPTKDLSIALTSKLESSAKIDPVTSPSTLPVKFPVTFPVTLPVILPVTLPVKFPKNPLEAYIFSSMVSIMTDESSAKIEPCNADALITPL